MSFLTDLRNLDRNNIGTWPAAIKTFFAVLLFVLILLLGWYVKISAQQEDLDRYVAQEDVLRKEFVKKQGRVVNLEALQQQLKDIEGILRQMLRQLPSKTEMPELLVDISQTALASGIETELFEPGVETPKEFYAEKPIKLRMIGTYHQFGNFISGVATLPRVVILTMHDVALKPSTAAPRGKVGASGDLVLEGTVKTYRYVEEDETSEGTPGTRPTATAAVKPGVK